KGVVLTHKNLMVCADESTDTYVKVKKGFRVLSILPMSHCYEFTITHILCLLQGCEIVFLGKPPATTILMRAFKEVRPHVILTVPLLIEKIYKAAVVPTLRDNPKISKLYNNPLTKWIVLRTVKTKLVSTMGGCIKFYGIGGAPLDKTVWDFLYDCHFPYALGYGLTETSPLIAGCGPKHKMHKKGYIGKPVKHCDVVLLDKNEEGVGEIAVKGPNVMKGYYNNDELNKEVFTEDGYFKTGDLGFIDKHGYLSIRGRVKTMILGPAGENIYPESIESIINNMEFVQESLVVPGDGGLVALIKVDLEAMQEKLKLGAEEVKTEAEKYLVKLKKTVNEQLSSFSKISDTELQEKDFERTPTQKIKRFLYSRKNKEDK
ncbi:MAG: AMP-binding protein, partial [Candidatus Ornithospirochaeta sp.]